MGLGLALGVGLGLGLGFGSGLGLGIALARVSAASEHHAATPARTPLPAAATWSLARPLDQMKCTHTPRATPPASGSGSSSAHAQYTAAWSRWECDRLLSVRVRVRVRMRVRVRIWLSVRVGQGQGQGQGQGERERERAGERERLPALGQLVARVPCGGEEAEQRGVRTRGGAEQDSWRAAAESQVHGP